MTANEYHKEIMNKAGIEFKNIEEDDVLTWDYFHNGYKEVGFYHLYSIDGSLKELKYGKFIDFKYRKYMRPFYKYKKELSKLQKSLKNKKKQDEKFDDDLGHIEYDIKKSSIFKTEKKKRNITPEESQRRSEQMKINIKKYWEKKKQEKENNKS